MSFPSPARSGQACLVDRSGRIVWINEAWRRLGSPFTPVDTPGAEDADYFELCESANDQPTDGQIITASLREVLAEDRDFLELEFTLRPTNGEPARILVRAQAIAIDGKRCAFVTHEDVTAARLAEASLRVSEERYRQFFEAAPDAVFLLGAEGDDLGRILDANSAAAASHGYTREEILGKRIGDLDAPDGAGRVRERIATLMREGHISFDVVHRRSDGTEFPVEVSARVASVGGRPCIISFNRDVAERHRVETELREQQLRLDIAVRASMIGFWDWNRQSNAVYLSPEWKAQLGYRDDELESSYEAWKSRVHPDDLDAVMTAVQAHSNGDTPHYTTEFRLRHRDGSYRWILARGQNFADEEGTPQRMVGCHVDITSQKEAERERAAMTQRLGQRQRLEAIGTLAGGIAHDFNNILSIIGGNVELAQDATGADSPAHEMLDEIKKAGDRARSLVRQILAFSRGESSKRHRVTLRPVLEEAVRLLRATIPQAITIDASIDDSTPDVVANPEQMHQVLVNLGTNAWHAIGDRPGKIEVRIAPGSAQGHVTIDVRDDGHGMTEESQQRIFEPFFTTKAAGLGSGLGLSIVHGVVEKHEGSIDVESAPGRGTTFRISLPPCLETGAATPQLPNRLPGAPVKVLLIDDQPSLLRVLSRGLEQQGCEVTAFEEPQQALAALESGQPFDILVTDHDMPAMRGIDVARAAQTARPELPVVLCSGYLRTDDLQEALDAGVARVVSKPVLASELIEQMRNLSRQRG